MGWKGQPAEQSNYHVLFADSRAAFFVNTYYTCPIPCMHFIIISPSVIDRAANMRVFVGSLLEFQVISRIYIPMFRVAMLHMKE